MSALGRIRPLAIVTLDWPLLSVKQTLGRDFQGPNSEWPLLSRSSHSNCQFEVAMKGS